MSTQSPEVPGGEIRPSFDRGWCIYPGCNQHITRLEEFNAQLAWECDRLYKELDQLRRDRGEEEYAA